MKLNRAGALVMPTMRPATARPWKPRFTIGGLMLTILAIAILLTILRPIAGLIQFAYPAMATLIRQYSTPETGIILSCLAIGGFITARLMSYDEK